MSVDIRCGDCRRVLYDIDDNSIDAIITDPPYELAFMGKRWDSTGIAFDTAVWEHCWHVLKPGGHLLAFGGSRTWHRLAVAIEDAGFEIRDSIAWLYGSGFPKSLDVSKAIDKAAGAEREVVGTKLGQPGYSLTDGNGDHRTYGKGLGNTGTGEAECSITAPATDAAKKWAGWGTALKPSFEPIVVARKPLIGTVAQNVLAHGTGALNIDACRIATSAEDAKAMERANTPGSGRMKQGGSPIGTFVRSNASGAMDTTKGRWPTNAVLDTHAAAELDQQSGIRPGARSQRFLNTTDEDSPTFKGSITDRSAVHPEYEGYNDSGGASRFFPTFKYQAKAPAKERPTVDGIAHPTVKPLALMQWLVKLVTPPGGTVLDPFAGTGTTGQAALLENMHAILIDIDPTYIPLIEKRLHR
jgi:DNA modification methylase